MPPCRLYPKPVQQPHPPIHVGGESRAALRRVAVHGQGWYTFNRLPEDLDEPLAQLDALLAEHGRSRADIELTVCPYMHAVTPELVAAYAERGVDRLVLLCLAFEESAVAGTMDDLAALLP
jgi:alkanesulfonate monooxygenase SsuD/methylene tetrahydromethanopterin reductase-like flavin-dependent oxidoreductase (luciferase family)